VSRERERHTHRQLSRAGGASLFRPLCLSLAASLARPPTLACALTVTHLLARALTVCCAGTCKYPGAEVQFVGYQYSGASGPLPGIPYSTLADDEGNVRASLPLPPRPLLTPCWPHAVGDSLGPGRWQRARRDRSLHTNDWAATVWAESQRIRLLDW
jgi:hypothetical protein